jgi:hypothetical protein
MDICAAGVNVTQFEQVAIVWAAMMAYERYQSLINGQKPG